MSMLPKKFYLDNFFDNFIDSSSGMDMKCDIYERDNKYYIEADIPGMSKENISVECNDGYLTIMASNEKETEENDKNYIRKERVYGNVKRQFYVGDVNQDEIEAEFKDGMLKIVVPKEEAKDNRKLIEIK